jgi:hypothetical protein
MPRYFFHLTNDGTISDDVGEEFEIVEAARGHALAVVRELSRNAPPDAFLGRHISVEDERGVVVFRIPVQPSDG